jgi:drug/metabolite transporter (DMT)-like permease
LGGQEPLRQNLAAKHQAAAIGVVLASSIFVAIVPNFSKLAYESGASVPLVIAARFVVTILLLGLLMLARRHGFRTSRRVLRLCLIGGIAAAAMTFGILSAITLIDISLVILILYLHPILIAWVGHMRGTYVLNRFRLCCCLLILAGLALALSVSFAKLDALGVVLAFIGASGCAGLVIANGEAVGEGGTVKVNFYTAIAALVLVSAVGMSIGPQTFPGAGTGWVGLVGTGAAFCLGLALFFAAVPYIGLERATLIGVIEPVLAIFIAMALFDERLTAVQWLGVVIVVAGLLLLEVPAKQINRLFGRVRSEPPA